MYTGTQLPSHARHTSVCVYSDLLTTSPMDPHSLVEAGGVGILVLLDDGHDEGDKLGPEVEVLDAGALLLRRNLPLLGLQGECTRW